MEYCTITLISDNHHKRTRHFWWQNGADKSLLQTYILYQAELDRYNYFLCRHLRIFVSFKYRFKNLVSECLDKLDEKREQRTKLVWQST